MTTKIRLTYFGMDGAGRTVTEAKKDAGAKIEAALSGTYAPTVLEHRGNAILVFREPAGWCYRHITDEKGAVRAGRVWGSANDKTEEEAIRGAKYSLAQDGWRPEDGDEAPDFVTDKYDRREFSRWVEFQMRHRKARAAGLTPDEAHHYACYDSSRPDLIERVDGAALATA